MRTWMKYLIIGWSIVSVGIVIISFQVMKPDFIQEDYRIDLVFKTPEKVAPNVERITEELFAGKTTLTTEELFSGKDVFDKISITKEEFVDKIKKAKVITLESKTNVNKDIYMVLPIYSFIIWCIPILVFSLVGVIFGRGKGTQMKEGHGK